MVLGACLLTLILALFIPSKQMEKKRGVLGRNSGVVGVINIEGPIVGSTEGSTFSGFASSKRIMEQLRQARDDEDVVAVVLRINSPGGSAAASQEIGVEVNRLREAGKKVVVSMGDVAASGGYWIAAGADKIVANPATMTGSIGVIMELQNFQGLMGKLGIRSEAIKSGPHKDMGSPTREITEGERDILQGMVNDIYTQFIDVVTKGREGKMTREQVIQLADGRIFTGRQARELGLVDELGNYYDAVRLAGQLAGIAGEPQTREYTTENLLDWLFSGWRSFVAWPGLLMPEQLEAWRQLRLPELK
ncbi:MAG: signal peptide peptidase SppA [Firmicutes bacterium]|nr:signal peptide peptidase SppA [Bacillota bacterium]